MVVTVIIHAYSVLIGILYIHVHVYYNVHLYCALSDALKFKFKICAYGCASGSPRVVWERHGCGCEGACGVQ